jgi:hypothetical protein
MLAVELVVVEGQLAEVASYLFHLLVGLIRSNYLAFLTIQARKKNFAENGTAKFARRKLGQFEAGQIEESPAVQAIVERG